MHSDSAILNNVMVGNAIRFRRFEQVNSLKRTPISQDYMLKTHETPYGTPHQASTPAFPFAKQQHSYSKSAHCIPK